MTAASFEITFTPVSNNNDTVSYCNELISKNAWRWSDGKHNKSKIGHYFAYYFHKQKIIFHKIRDIVGPENKYPHWHYPGDQCKNILILSQPLHELKWNEWEALNGPQSHMSTYTTTNLKTQRPLVYNYLDHLSSNEETES